LGFRVVPPRTGLTCVRIRATQDPLGRQRRLRRPPTHCRRRHDSLHGVRLRGIWSSCSTFPHREQDGHLPAHAPPHLLLTAQEARGPDGSHLAREGGGLDKSGARCAPPPFPAAAEGGESGPQPLAGKHDPLRPRIPAPTTPSQPPRSNHLVGGTQGHQNTSGDPSQHRGQRSWEGRRDIGYRDRPELPFPHSWPRDPHFNWIPPLDR